MEQSRGGFNILSLGRWIFLAALLAFTALPMLWMVSTSIKSEFAAIQQPPTWIPAEPTLNQYTTLLTPTSPTGQRFLGYIRNSIIVSSATTILMPISESMRYRSLCIPQGKWSKISFKFSLIRDLPSRHRGKAFCSMRSNRSAYA